MNQVQRKFLIDKIQEKTKAKVKELRDSELQYPSASNYIFKAALNNELKLRSEEHILKAIKNKALNAKEGANWLSEERMGSNKESTIRLDLTDVIDLPLDYFKEFERVKSFNNNIRKEIGELNIYLDTIEVRIQLASDKTLSQIIKDVDDIGDIKLIDSSLKLLN